MTTVGSLFTGMGGLDLALDGQVVYTCEKARAPRTVLAERYRGATDFRDVTDLPHLPTTDVLTGGSPCQSNSVAGTRAGMVAGAPSGLWSHQLAAIDDTHPSWAVWENVKGAISAKATTAADDPSSGEDEPVRVRGRGAAHRLRALGRVLSDLDAIGYDAAWTILGARDVGAAHRRDRLFVLARRRGGSPAPLRLATRDYMGPLAGLVLGSPVPDLGVGDAPKRLLPTPAVNDMSRYKDVEAFTAWRLDQKASDGTRAVHGPGLDVEVRTAAGEVRLGLTGSSAPVRTDALSWGQYAEAVARAEATFGPAPFPVQPGRRRPWQVDPAFVEWMMGLPAGWMTGPASRAGVGHAQVLGVLGNGVVPRQAGLALAVCAASLVTGLVDRPWAAFDAARDVWVLPDGVTRFDGVWPKSGVMVGGVVAHGVSS